MVIYIYIPTKNFNARSLVKMGHVVHLTGQISGDIRNFSIKPPPLSFKPPLSNKPPLLNLRNLLSPPSLLSPPPPSSNVMLELTQALTIIDTIEGKPRDNFACWYALDHKIESTIKMNKLK